MVVGIAAAAVGRLVSLPRAFLGGIGLGVLIALANTFLPRWSEDHPLIGQIQENVTPAMPFLVLFGLLVLWPAVRRTRDASDPLSGVDPPPPSLAASTRSQLLTRLTWVAGVLFFVLVGWVVFARADPSWLYLVTQAVIMGTIFLSITVITGMAGEISLCQGTFAAIGAFAAFQLTDRMGMSVLAAALVGAAVAAAVAAVLSLPVLRLGGVWVAIATLAFAYFFDSVMIRLPWIGGGDTSLMQGTRVPRPTIGPWDLADDKQFLVLAIVVFVLVAFAVIRIREGTVGRTLRAVRGSEVAAQSIGISPARARLVAFAVSAFIAGLGGALLAMHQENVNYGGNFAPFVALFWLVIVVSLGSRTVEGAAQAAIAFALFDAVILKGALFEWILRSPDRVPDIFPLSPTWRLVLFGLGALQFARHPEGMVEFGKRRAHRRVEGWLARAGSDRDEGPPEPPPEPAPVGEKVA
jgi:ABC-type branched-subunit amino acid transport system permease subunit